MKRRTGRFLCGCGALLLAAGLTGCSSSKELTAQDVLEKMNEASEAKEIVSADWSLDVDMSMTMDIFGTGEASTMSMSMTGEGNTLANTAGEEDLTYSTVTMTVSVFGFEESVETESYTRIDADQNVTTYVMTDGVWYRTTVEGGSETEELLALVENYRESFTLSEEKVTYSDASCYELKGELKMDELGDAMDSYSSLLSLSELTDYMNLDGRSFQIVVYVDENSYLPLWMSLSLEEASGTEGESETAAEETAAEETVAEETAGDEGEILYEFNTFSMTMEYSYPDEGEIVIPDEALNAEGLAAGEEEEEGLPTTEDSGSQYESLSNVQLLKEYEEGDAEAVLYDSEELTITLDKIYTDGGDNAYVDMRLTNGSSENLEVCTSEIAVNSTMMSDSYLYTSVGAGATEEATLYLIGLSSVYVEDIGSISMIFEGYSSSTYDTVVNSGALSVVLDEDKASYQVAEGLGVVYEDDHVQVTAYERTENDGCQYLPVCIVNKTDSTMGLYCESIETGGQEISATVYTYLIPASCAYASIEVYDETLEGADIAELGTVNFRLTAYDLLTYETLFETGEISLPVSD